VVAARIERPQNARSDRTRTAILDALWRLIEEHGAEDVTIDQVARLAGSSRRAVYLHFASRTELLLGLFHHMNERLDLHTALRPIQEATTPEAALAAWARFTAEYHWRILPVARAIDVARRSDPAAQAMWDQAMTGWLSGSRQLAAALAASGRLAPPWTVDTATDMLWALSGVELVEDLITDRQWTVEAYGAALETLTVRTFLSAPDDRTRTGDPSG
jgi:AcrR family transcriptional regulator